MGEDPLMSEEKKKPKREFNAYTCGGCRWSIHLNDSRGRCRRFPPKIPGKTVADADRYPSVELGALGCGEWVAPPR
jgi:hypothetical protein